MTTVTASTWNRLIDGLRLFSLYGLSLSLFLAPSGVSAGLVLVWVWFVAWLLTRPSPLPRHVLVWLMLAFVLYVLLLQMLLQALFPGVVMAGGLAMLWRDAFSWAQLAVIVPIAYALRADERLMLRLLLLVLIGLLLGTLWRLDWALWLGDADAYLDSRPGFGFPALAYALYAGTALIGLLTLRRRCWYRHDGRLRWWAVPLLLAASVLLAEGVVMTQARNSWLALTLIALLGAGLWLRGQWQEGGRISRTPIVLASTGLLLLIGFNAGEIGERLRQEQAVAGQLLRGEAPADQITSFTLRWHVQRFGLALWQERPWLGWGPGASYPLMVASVSAAKIEDNALGDTGVEAEAESTSSGGMASPISDRLAETAVGISDPADGVLKHLHNSYLELLAQLGLVGFGLWMLIAIGLLWAVYAAVRPGRLSQDLGLFLGLAFLYLAIWSLFNFRMLSQDFRGYWALLAGIALSIALYRRDGVKRPSN